MLAHIDQILAGRYVSEQRMLLDASVVRNGKVVASAIALNDVVVKRHDTGRMVEYQTFVDGRLRQHPPRRRLHHRHADRLHRLRAQLRRPDRGTRPRRPGADAHLPAHAQRPAAGHPGRPGCGGPPADATHDPADRTSPRTGRKSPATANVLGRLASGLERPGQRRTGAHRAGAPGRLRLLRHPAQQAAVGTGQPGPGRRAGTTTSQAPPARPPAASRPPEIRHAHGTADPRSRRHRGRRGRTSTAASRCSLAKRAPASRS